MNGFLNRLKSRGRPDSEAGESKLVLAAFGKHPGWDDHMPGIGVETDALAFVKQMLYVGGIGRQIDSGAWERLEPEKRREGFDHVFVWQQAAHLLLGQIWSSTDRKGRAKYPMILCADSQGIPPQWLLENAGPELDRLQARCKTSATAEQVAEACQASQERLRLLVPPKAANPESPSVADSRRRFLEHPEIGPDRIGLLRILHELRMTSGSDASQAGTQANATESSCLLRVPVVGGSNLEALALWLAFFKSATPKGTPVFVTHRASTDWLDVIIGEPTGDYFFCLGASVKALPLTTQIPYDLSPQLKVRLQQVESQFLGLEKTSLPVQTIPIETPPVTKAPPTIKAPPVTIKNPVASAPPTTAAATAPTAPPGPQKGLFLGGIAGAVILLGAAGIWLMSGHRDAKPAPAEPASPPVAATSPDSVATGLEQNYQTAIQNGRTAFARGDYPAALSQAGAALRLKAGDLTATKLKNDAQDKIDEAARGQKQYDSAMREGLAEYSRGDYAAAMTQAAAALALRPADPAALKLQADAQSQIDISKIAAGQDQQKYDAAMTAAKAALDNQDFPTTLAQADIALSIRPNDPAADQLKANVQSLKEAAALARQTQKAYTAAMTDARAAFDNKDYTTALTKTDEALKLRDHDAPALALKNTALAAQAADREKAAQAAEYTSLMRLARATYAAGDYATAIQKTGAALGILPNDPPATELRKQAINDQDLLNVKSLIKQGKFAQAKELCQTHAGTPAFDELAGNMKTFIAGRYNTELEFYLVSFGRLAPGSATSPAARQASLIVGDLPDEQRDQCLKEVKSIKAAFQAAGSLDAAKEKQIDDLITAINDHS